MMWHTKEGHQTDTMAIAYSDTRPWASTHKSLLRLSSGRESNLYWHFDDPTFGAMCNSPHCDYYT